MFSMRIAFSILLTFLALASTTLAAEILLRHSTIDVHSLIESSRSRLSSHANPIPQSVDHSQHAANLLSMDAGRPVRMPIDDRAADRQWLVHIKSPITSQVKRNINAHIAPHALSETYLPHDTFLLVAPREVAERIHDAPGVLYVAEFAPVFKHDPATNDRTLAQLEDKYTERREKLLASRGGVELAGLPTSLERVKLHVRLASQSSRAVNEAAARAWVAELAAEFGIHDLELEYASSTDFVILSVGKESTHNVIRNLASFHEVHWVEVAPKVETFNKHTHAVVQAGSNTYTDTPVWERDLRGEGQVIGIADTGIDVDMCFFWDENEDIAYSGVNMNHRKIVTYHSFGSDQADDVDGHGTHTSGTVAGDVLASYVGDSSPAELDTLRDYNGMANKAKLAFYDLGTSDEFEVPEDIYEDLYRASYEQTGTRVHSHSWGASTPYDQLSLMTDRFAYDYPDFLPVYAAGNEGEGGLFTMASPAIAKNALAVGASTNTADSFFELRLAVGLEVEAPASAATTIRLVPAMFGPSIFEDEYATAFRSASVAVASPFQACTDLTNAAELDGKVVLLQRGSCNFIDKVRRCTAAGGILCIVINSDDTHLPMGCDERCGGDIVPSALITMTEGQILLDNVADLRVSAPVAVEVPEQQKDLLAGFSSLGPVSDGRLKPDIVAPGQFVQSARSDGRPDSYNCNGSDSLLQLQGTSMATPLAAAGVAIVREYFMKGFFPSGEANTADAITPSGALMKAIMINSGQPISEVDDEEGTRRDLALPSVYQGYGQMQMDRVLKFNDSQHSLFFSQGNSVATLESQTYCFNIASFDVPFKATLVWTDPAPTQSSQRILINDLDLTVAHVDTEQVYMGNNIHFMGTDNILRHPHDELNNVEQVWIQPGSIANQESVDAEGTTAATGVYLVRVIGFGVPVDDRQNYSLVVTGDFDQSTSASCDAYPNSNICPRDCSGNGQCTEGRCVCDNGFFSSDCSQTAATLELGGDSREASLQQAGWEFFRFEVDPNSDELFGGDNSDHVVKVWFDRTAGRGDPDLYARQNEWPTLERFEFSNVDCDSCPGPEDTTRHVTDIDPSVLRDKVGGEDRSRVANSSESMTNSTSTNTVTLVVGMYGFCCEDSEISIRVGTGLPEMDPSLTLSPLLVGVVVAIALICCCGLVYLCFQKRAGGRGVRRRNGLPSDFHQVPSLDQHHANAQRHHPQMQLQPVGVDAIPKGPSFAPAHLVSSSPLQEHAQSQSRGIPITLAGSGSSASSLPPQASADAAAAAAAPHTSSSSRLHQVVASSNAGVEPHGTHGARAVGGSTDRNDLTEPLNDRGSEEPSLLRRSSLSQSDFTNVPLIDSTNAKSDE